MCQGLHISKIIASILSHAPEECIIVRSYYDINEKVRKDIQLAIKTVLDYIDEKLQFFPSLSRIYEVEADILNPFSVMKSLDSIIHETRFFNLDPILDLSSGTTPANIGLYLFALQHKIPQVFFSFPGERYKEENSDQTELIELDGNIEFTRKETFGIPIIDVDIRDFDQEIIFRLASIREGKVSTLKELNELLGREKSSKNLMSLSRECSKLESLGLIVTDRSRRNKSITITMLGRQYSKFNQFKDAELKIVWQRKEEKSLEK